jgi:hypothetical protein
LEMPAPVSTTMVVSGGIRGIESLHGGNAVVFVPSVNVGCG